MSWIFRGSPRVIAGSLFLLVAGLLAPSQSAAVEFLIQRESDHTAIVSVAPGQGGFDMTFAETTSPYDTTITNGLPFPVGWRTVVVDLVQAFDPTTNNSGTGSTSIAQLPLSSWGTSVNTMQQNGYALTGGTTGVTLLNRARPMVRRGASRPACLCGSRTSPPVPFPAS